MACPVAWSVALYHSLATLLPTGPQCDISVRAARTIAISHDLITAYLIVYRLCSWNSIMIRRHGHDVGDRSATYQTSASVLSSVHSGFTAAGTMASRQSYYSCRSVCRGKQINPLLRLSRIGRSGPDSSPPSVPVRCQPTSTNNVHTQPVLNFILPPPPGFTTAPRRANYHIPNPQRHTPV